MYVYLYAETDRERERERERESERESARARASEQLRASEHPSKSGLQIPVSESFYTTTRFRDYSLGLKLENVRIAICSIFGYSKCLTAAVISAFGCSFPQ